MKKIIGKVLALIAGLMRWIIVCILSLIVTVPTVISGNVPE